MQPTIDQIVQDLIDTLPKEALDEVRLLQNGNRHTLQFSIGMYIRNKYNLWGRTWTPELVNGIDCSPEHPDAISYTIIERLFNHVMGKQ